jgi:type II secretory pathway pseudopilin PulG
VVAIIALLSSIALIALMNARQKSRDAKRLGDMTQMNTALELYFSSYKGYPSSPTLGIPGGIVPDFAASLPGDPMPADGGCELLSYHNYDSAIPAGPNGTGYYYYPSGTAFSINNGPLVYPDFGYYFCLGNTTGNYPAGIHKISPTGVR